MKATISRNMRREIATGVPLVRHEVVAKGLRGNTLSEMASRGVLYRVSRGVYASSEGSHSEYFDYEIAAKVAPRGVFTLFSALRIHGLTDENPTQMTMAIPLNAHAPNTTLPLRFVYMMPNLLASDVVEMGNTDSPFRVFTVERTIAECFKARNKIGIDVAVGALRDAIAKKKIDFSVLGKVLKDCRMLRIALPYLACMK